MSILSNIMGIYPESVDKAYERCQEVLEECLLEDKYDELDLFFENKFKNYLDWDDATNSLIECLFDGTREIIESIYPFETEWHINGYASDFRVTNDIIKYLVKAKVEKNLIKYVAIHDLENVLSMEDTEFVDFVSNSNKEEIERIVEALEKGADVAFYESVEELGALNEDNGCRETDDTDETFGQFLIQAYKNGNSSTTIFIELSSGRIMEIG